MEIGESRVDILERLGVGDEVVNLERAVLVSLDNLRQLSSALDTAKSRSLPHSAGDQLERSGGNLLASSSNTNDDGLAPALVAGLESLSHDGHVSGTVKCELTASVGHLDQLVDNGGSLGQLGGVDEVGGAKLVSPGLLVAIDVDDNDLAGLSLLGTHDNGQTNTASSKDSDVVALLHVGSDGGGSVTGGHTTSKQTGSVLGGLGVNGDKRDVGDNGVLGERRAAHVREELLALALESGGSVGQNSLTLGSSHLLTQVGLAGLAELALLALGGVEQNDRVALLDAGDTLADRLDDSGALVTEHRGENTLGIRATESVGVSVADSGVGDLDSNLSLLGRSNLDLFESQGLSSLPGNSGLASDGFSFSRHCVVLCVVSTVGALDLL